MNSVLELVGALLVMLFYAWLAVMAAVAVMATALCFVEGYRCRQRRRARAAQREAYRAARLQEHTARSTIADDEIFFWVGPNAERTR
jgi:hypothetical protein